MCIYIISLSLRDFFCDDQEEAFKIFVRPNKHSFLAPKNRDATCLMISSKQIVSGCRMSSTINCGKIIGGCNIWVSYTIQNLEFSKHYIT